MIDVNNLRRQSIQAVKNQTNLFLEEIYKNIQINADLGLFQLHIIYNYSILEYKDNLADTVLFSNHYLHIVDFAEIKMNLEQNGFEVVINEEDDKKYASLFISWL